MGVFIYGLTSLVQRPHVI